MRAIGALTVIVLLFSFPLDSQALLRRCYQCRSRGELGSCKDPFSFNETAESEPGLSAIPCASGWCGKVIEGGGAYAVDDYDQAVQRMCVQRGPDDNQDRCAYTVFNYKKVFMCFCQGDLCNGAWNLNENSSIHKLLIIAASAIVLCGLGSSIWN